CRDDSRGFLKFIKLFFKHRKVRNSYDYLIVGYPGHIVVWLAKLISSKPIIFDALCTMYEGEVLSRNLYRHNPFMIRWVLFIDWLAVKCSNLILVESEAQKKYFINKFNLSDKKVVRIFTGADEEVFYLELDVKKRDKFTVLFRGRFLPEAGIEYIVRAAKLLENDGIEFIIIGGGVVEDKIASLIQSLNPNNLEWIRQYLPSHELRKKMLECHVSLGQFENHIRLQRTIPHKASESLAMGLPYVTGKNMAVSELLTDRENCLMVSNADPKDLADKILELKNDSNLTQKIANNGHLLYKEKLSSVKLGREIIRTIEGL
ncbi:MAG: glycosyltransferase family 4 protein, partial [Nanoarchaeota archaeon]|nr:glycosyltransferase family 4 protein [Nanoarchaeota archaeon]